MNNQANEQIVSAGEFWEIMYGQWSKVCKRRELLGSREHFDMVIELLNMPAEAAQAATQSIKALIEQLNNESGYVPSDFVLLLAVSEFSGLPDGQRFREWAKREWDKHSAA